MKNKIKHHSLSLDSNNTQNKVWLFWESQRMKGERVGESRSAQAISHANNSRTVKVYCRVVALVTLYSCWLSVNQENILAMDTCDLYIDSCSLSQRGPYQIYVSPTLKTHRHCIIQKCNSATLAGKLMFIARILPSNIFSLTADVRDSITQTSLSSGEMAEQLGERWAVSWHKQIFCSH